MFADLFADLFADVERQAQSYWVRSPGRGRIETHPLPAVAPGDVRLRTLATGVSPGTERLVGLRGLPAEAHASMRCAYMDGDFHLPVKYGYSLVGRRDDGRRFFVMHPHQDEVVVAEGDLVALPDELPSLRALLFPALETAQNALWDAELRAGEAPLVVGGGLIGVAVAFVLSRRVEAPVQLVEASRARREYLSKLPWLSVHAPDRTPSASPDCLFHCSATQSGLQWCIDHGGFEARVLELSWYGAGAVSLRLGGSFHYRRQRVISSQVSHVASPVRDRITREDRAAAVLEHLRAPELDQLVTPVARFSELPGLMQTIYEQSAQTLLPAVLYPAGGNQP